MDQIIVGLRGVCFTYPLAPEPALIDIDLSVAPGEFVSIVGANGAGKSTLCQVIRGLAPQFTRGTITGQVSVNGHDAIQTSIGELTRDVGYVFQNPFTQLSGVAATVFDELAYGLGNLGVPPAEMRDRVERMLQATKLTDLRDRNPFELSGGQQQRVALASILVMDQPILVIDEPTSQLDPATTDAMFDLIEQAHAAGRTIVLAEHKMEQVAQFSDRVIVMQAGRIVLQGTPAEVFTDPLCAKAGVRMPESMYLQRALVARGLDLPPHPLSIPELINDIAAATGKTPHADSTDIVPDIDSSDIKTSWIDVEHVGFTYKNGVEALHDVSLRVAAGESVAIIGQNGAGKTTLAKLINGLLKPTGGEVILGGESTTAWTAARTARRVGYVFQNPDDQIFNKSVRSEVAYAPTRLRGASETADQVQAALELTGLDRVSDVNPYDLPLSVRKFVTIASVLALDTDAIILDEPTAGQDLIGLNKLIRVLRDLRERGKTVITITHDMEFVSQHFQRTIVMADRQIVVDGPTDQVFYDSTALKRAQVNEPAFVQVARAFVGPSAGLSADRLVAGISR